MTVEISTTTVWYHHHTPYINQIAEKPGSSYQNLVLSWFRLKKQILVNKTFDEAASPQSAKKNVANL